MEFNYKNKFITEYAFQKFKPPQNTIKSINNKKQFRFSKNYESWIIWIIEAKKYLQEYPNMHWSYKISMINICSAAVPFIHILFTHPSILDNYIFFRGITIIMTTIVGGDWRKKGNDLGF